MVTKYLQCHSGLIIVKHVISNFQLGMLRILRMTPEQLFGVLILESALKVRRVTITYWNCSLARANMLYFFSAINYCGAIHGEKTNQKNI